MNIPLYIINAFTDKPFSGNPAAVCPLQKWLEDSTLQAVAAQNNLSETAFFVPKKETYHLRWFTPNVEVPLCGHATLAASHVLFLHLDHGRDVIVYETLSGALQVRQDRDLLLMNFPVKPLSTIDASDTLLQALGKKPNDLLASNDTYFAVYEKEKDILDLSPDFLKLEQCELPCTIITAPGTRSDFVSRFFAPKEGIPEDPVTGSAHCSLVPYWADRLQKNTLHAIQVSKRRGELFCEFLGDRVQIGGMAVTYAVGEIVSINPSS